MTNQRVHTGVRGTMEDRLGARDGTLAPWRVACHFAPFWFVLDVKILLGVNLVRYPHHPSELGARFSRDCDPFGEQRPGNVSHGTTHQHLRLDFDRALS